MAQDLRHRNKQADVSIEKVILTKQLSSLNSYQREDQDPLEQLVEILESKQQAGHAGQVLARTEGGEVGKSWLIERFNPNRYDNTMSLEKLDLLKSSRLVMT